MGNHNSLLTEIRNKGIEIDNINQLIYISSEHRDTIPIFLKYLRQYSNKDDKEWIVRSLGVKGFTEATNALVDEYYKSPNDSSLKWTIGNTISIIQDKNSVDRILEIVKEKKHGTSRQMFCVALGKLKAQKYIPIFLDLLSDSDVTGHVIMALSYFDDLTLIPKIEPYTKHEKLWIRKEAQRAIKKIKNNIDKNKVSYR